MFEDVEKQSSTLVTSAVDESNGVNVVDLKDRSE